MPNKMQYQAVIGLEIHAQLATNSKLFCGDATSFGAEPNTHVSPITLGHPGTLPKTNAKAVEFAIKMGLACGSTIAKENYFAFMRSILRYGTHRLRFSECDFTFESQNQNQKRTVFCFPMYG